MLYPGQEIVCVDAKERLNGPTGLVDGGIYTFVRYDKPAGIIIAELDANPCVSFHADRFRPVVKTDISVFTKMLAPTPKKKVLEDA